MAYAGGIKLIWNLSRALYQYYGSSQKYRHSIKLKNHLIKKQSTVQCKVFDILFAIFLLNPSFCSKQRLLKCVTSDNCIFICCFLVIVKFFQQTLILYLFSRRWRQVCFFENFSLPNIYCESYLWLCDISFLLHILSPMAGPAL